MKIPAPKTLLALSISLLALAGARAVELEVTAEPPGPIDVGDEVTINLAITGWVPGDSEVDAIAYNIDFDTAIFEFVSGSSVTLADGSEFLALPSQAGSYNLGDDSSEALTEFGRYIFGASDTADGTSGSLGPDGKVGSFRLRAIAPGTGFIKSSTNSPKQIFSDPELFGIDPTGGVVLGETEVTVRPIGMTYRLWAEKFQFASEKDAEPGSDPDCDGRSNILEYYLGADPLKPDPERDPQPGAAGDSFSTLTFERPAGAGVRTDARGFGERSTDLENWDRDGVVVDSIGPVDPGTGRETVVLSSTVPSADLLRELLRLKVQLDL